MDMKRSWTVLAALLLMTVLPLGAAAQDAADLLEQGKMAFREGRYEDAARAFERATDKDPQNGEAFFLLARVYAETPLKDARKADRALDKALALEPDNLRFLVGKLQQMRAESTNFFAERLREARRAELAHKILAMDSTNAFAHEELGRNYIHDFWRYRNAIMLPSMRFGNRAFGTASNAMMAATNEEAPRIGDANMANSEDFGFSGSRPGNTFFDPDEVFQADRFDLETLRARGVPVQDLSRRAQDAYDKAIGHLKKALDADPRRRSVYDELMEIYALKGAFAEARDVLREMYAFFPEDAATWRYMGLTHYRLGDLDAAYKSFETAFAYMTEDEEAAFTSLDHLLPEDEAKAYHQDPVAYAARFWTSKDPRFLTPFNERKIEHFARLTYADLLYGSDDLNLRGWDTQRGRILVRYGLPRFDVVILPSNTATSADAVLEQAFREGVTGEVGTSADMKRTTARTLAQRGSSLDMATEANTFNIWDYGEFRFVFEDPFRNNEYRLYSPPADQISQGVNPWLNDYVIRARETFRNTPERYEYEAPGRQIEIPYLVTAFKGEQGHADLYVNYGIPITEKPPKGQDMINVTANVGAFLISDNRDILVERRRTIYGLQTARILSFKETHLWVDSQQMTAPPGTHEVSMEFETASGGTVAVQRRAVDVPDFTGDRLAVSDLLLAYHVEESPGGRPAREADVVRRGLSITPAPWSVFSARQPIYLYFETYNLARNAEGRTDYEVEALLVPKEEARGLAKVFKGLLGGKKGVSVTLPGTGTSTEEGQYLILDAANQKSGLYTLILRVRDNVARRTVERDQDLFLE